MTAQLTPVCLKGVMQFVCSMMYNFCDSLDIDFFLDKEDWHRLTNVTGLSYGVNVLVYLMANVRRFVRGDLLFFFLFFFVFVVRTMSPWTTCSGIRPLP